MNKKFFGKSIKQFRKEKNLTQEELANKLNVSPRTISSWECGDSYPDVEAIEELCKVLEISEQRLFDEGRNLETVEEKSRSVIKTVGIISLIIVVLVGALTLVMLSFGEGSSSKQKTATNANAERDAHLKAYYDILKSYEIYGTEEFKSLSIDEQYEIVDTDEQVLANFSTEELYELFCEYPFNWIYVTGDTIGEVPSQGMEMVEERSTIFRVMVSRDDCIDVLKKETQNEDRMLNMYLIDRGLLSMKDPVKAGPLAEVILWEYFGIRPYIYENQ